MPPFRRRDRRLIPSADVDLHGLTSDQAILKVDRYLHDAFRSGYYTTRVIHGKGTGVLQIAVRDYLSHHPLVNSYRWGRVGEGGTGVTVVELDGERR